MTLPAPTARPKAQLVLPADFEAVGLGFDDLAGTAGAAIQPAAGVPAAGRTCLRCVTPADRVLDQGAVRAELHPPPAAGRREGEVVAAVDADPVVVLLERVRPAPDR